LQIQNFFVLLKNEKNSSGKNLIIIIEKIHCKQNRSIGEAWPALTVEQKKSSTEENRHDPNLTRGEAAELNNEQLHNK
jgi:hypothetical protein